VYLLVTVFCSSMTNSHKRLSSSWTFCIPYIRLISHRSSYSLDFCLHGRQHVSIHPHSIPLLESFTFLLVFSLSGLPHSSYSMTCCVSFLRLVNTHLLYFRTHFIACYVSLTDVNVGADVVRASSISSTGDLSQLLSDSSPLLHVYSPHILCDFLCEQWRNAR
jgi:hypothetical protein